MNPVLYLHGFASGPRSHKARYFQERLERAGRQVFIPDLAAGDFEHLTIAGQLAVLERAADSRRVDLIGSSMGGYLAALYASRHPEVARLVLLAPAFAFASRWHEWLGAEGVERWRTSGSLEVFHYGENRLCGISYGLLEDAHRYEEFPDFQQPALIFHGALDTVVPAALSERFATAHSNARLHVLPSGHELLDVLDYMGQRTEEFLAQ